MSIFALRPTTRTDLQQPNPIVDPQAPAATPAPVSQPVAQPEAIPAPAPADATTVAGSRTLAARADAAARARTVPTPPAQVLREGDRGTPVASLQRSLTYLGHLKGTNAVDGVFGPNTEGAVRDFQQQHGLHVDGIYGPQTKQAMQNALNATVTGTSPTTTPVATHPTTPSTTPGTTVEPTPGLANPAGKLGDVYRSNTQRVADAAPSSRYTNQVNQAVDTMGKKNAVIDEIARKANLPPSLVGALWHREASFKEGVYLHNGDPLGSPTTHVPKGIMFGKDQFVDAAVHALNRFKGNAQALGLNYNSKDVGAMATYAEYYNGLGYRNRGKVSPYVFAGTDQYQGGMYVADGQYNANVFDSRPGVVSIIDAYAKRYGHY